MMMESKYRIEVSSMDNGDGHGRSTNNAIIVYRVRASFVYTAIHFQVCDA